MTERSFPAMAFDIQHDAIEYVSQLAAVPDDVWSRFQLSYFGQWATYEEHGSMLILKADDEYFILEGGYSVMGDNREETWSDLRSIPESEAIQMANEFEEICENHIGPEF